jgi:ubiquilin
MLSILAGGSQTNARRSTTTGADARQQTPAGLGGLGMPNASSLSQLMQNPAISQMMQSIFSNPQTMNQVFTLCAYKLCMFLN